MKRTLCNRPPQNAKWGIADITKAASFTSRLFIKDDPMRNPLFLLLILLLHGGLAVGQPAAKPVAGWTELVRAGAKIRAEAGNFTALRMSANHPFSTPDPESTATAFLATYGPALGLTADDSARLLRQTTAANGHHYLRYQQQHRGLPVFGAVFTIEVAGNNQVQGLFGTLLPSTSFAPAPSAQNVLTGPAAPDFTRQATAALTDRYPFAQQWTVSEADAVYIRTNPWVNEATDPLRPARVFIVSEPGGNRAERVFLDATTGRLRFRHQLHCELSRQLNHFSSASFNRVWLEGDAFPGRLDADDQEMLLATAETYNLFARTFGRNSFDGQGAPLRAITRASLSNCPNANAINGLIRHCTGVVGDDIVAHEWTHNYINSMNGLIYAFESGAINEAYADIFGEVVDLLNDRGNDANDDQPRTGCDDGNLRWMIAEDATALDSTLRDLWMPECKTDAPAIRHPLYVCPDPDSSRGDVHSNSGPVRKTFTLLTDGGIFNGDTIMPIGMTKALHLFHHVNNAYLTPVTDFHALAEMLLLAGEDLIGHELTALTLVDLPAMNSGQSFTAADLMQVERAIRATQLRQQPNCATFPTLAQDPPAPCAAASLPAFIPFFAQQWEDSLGGWSADQFPLDAATWTDKPWAITDRLPDGRAGLGVFAPNPLAGNCQDNLESGTVTLTSPLISLPEGESVFLLTFDHYYATQESFDGGLLEYAPAEEAFRSVPSAAFIYNGYDGPLANGGNDNPLAGQPAFHGTDKNSTSGSWGRSIVDLNALGLVAGEKFRLRWVFGQDGCDGRLGWYLDDVLIGFCGEAALPVSWLRFTASAGKNEVGLDWAVADATNHAGFYVTRRGEGEIGFTDLAFVAAGADLRYTDWAVTPGNTYAYRLRQVDRDGTFSFSPVVTASVATATGLQIMPNPARDWLTVVGPPDATTATLFTANGKQIAAFFLTDGRGRFGLNALPPGVYLVRVGQEVRRVMITR